MKKLLPALMALCLVLTVLFAASPIAWAAKPSGAENCLQHVVYYDPNSGEIDPDSICIGILIQDVTGNLVLTKLPPVDELILAYEDANSALYAATDGQPFVDDLYLYSAPSDFGSAEGFYPASSLYQGETVYIVYFNNNGDRVYMETTAIYLENGCITLADSIGEASHPHPVLNSRNEICAIYYKDICFTWTPEEVFFGNTETPAETPTAPITTEPPKAEYSANEKLDIKLPSELPELDELYDQAVIKKASVNIGLIAILAVTGVTSLLIIIIVIKRKQAVPGSDAQLSNAEEGTELNIESAGTGLVLLFKNGSRIPVTQSISIGRASGNTIMVPSSSTNVSGRHCEIIIKNRAAYLRDMGSTNGTFINGHRLPAGQPIQLQPGMNISLGGANSAETFLVASEM